MMTENSEPDVGDENALLHPTTNSQPQLLIPSIASPSGHIQRNEDVIQQGR